MQSWKSVTFVSIGCSTFDSVVIDKGSGLGGGSWGGLVGNRCVPLRKIGSCSTNEEEEEVLLMEVVC